MNRRKFLQTAASLLSATAFPELAFGEESSSRIRILNKIAGEDLASLREVLEVQPELPVEPIDSGLKLKVDRWPIVIYNLSTTTKENGVEIGVESRGSAFVLNNNGFFLTANHVYMPDEGIMMLVYDPVKGYALSATPLASSEDFDLFLGRVHFPRDFSIPPTRICSSHNPSSNMVYTTGYTNNEYLTSIIKEVIGTGKFTSECGPNVPCFKLGRLLPQIDNWDELRAIVGIGNLTDTTYEDGTPLCEKGERSFIAEIVPGNSGSPVLDIHNRLVGILTERSSATVASGDLLAGHKVKHGIYTGPERIREMIESYIEACE